jgi:UDP-N-acetylmuramate--alanine ligase
VFQPHLLSRLRAFLDDFALALLLADQVLVAPVYGAREASAPGELVSESVRLTRAVLDRGGEAIFLPDHSSIVEHLARRIQPGDVVLTLGAGDVTDVCRVLAGQLA